MEYSVHHFPAITIPLCLLTSDPLCLLWYGGCMLAGCYAIQAYSYIRIHLHWSRLFFRVTSLALGQSYICPSASEAALKNVVNTSHNSQGSDNTAIIKQHKTKPCPYSIGYTVHHIPAITIPLLLLTSDHLCLLWYEGCMLAGCYAIQDYSYIRIHLHWSRLLLNSID